MLYYNAYKIRSYACEYNEHAKFTTPLEIVPL